MSTENASPESSGMETTETEGTGAAIQAELETPDALEELETPQVKTYKVKIDGQEVDITEDELLKGYQSTKSAQQRFNEAALMRKQAEELVKIAKNDPRKLLTHPDIGVDLKKFANDILAEMMEEELLSPQEKEQRAMKKKLAEYEAERERQRAEAEQAEMDKYVQLYEQEYTNGIVEALETSGLPRTETTVKKMASMMLLALENGLDVKPKDVVEFVKRDYMAEVKSLFGAANEDIILSLLGDDISNKVVKGHLKKVKPKQAETKVTEVTTSAKKSQSQSRTLTRDEWLNQIRNRAKG